MRAPSYHYEGSCERGAGHSFTIFGDLTPATIELQGIPFTKHDTNKRV